MKNNKRISPELISRDNHTLFIIDQESQMAFGNHSHNPMELRNNIGLVCGTSKIFNIPTVVTTIARDTFTGPVFPEILEVFPNQDEYINRTTLNAWEDDKTHKAVTGKNKKKIVMSGSWTSVCLALPALSAYNEGYEVYVIKDSCCDMTKEVHETAIQRLIQAGIRPITSMQYLLEIQRDWANKETYDDVMSLIKRFGGTYGIGVQYAEDMVQK
ncbi:isochorismatase family protein [Gelidibacter pelagius]|uniref:Isochorismatase family protein n=1 Tax=Gelidibacter pelagius TaxID=2819985 RepID=A0ABS3SX78_9FLAO|nr:isochorismatase family protein [Gelidibacter pelagius]MBO3099488.1 isochorismatase family protein [Gelidibacter pelagius]